MSLIQIIVGVILLIFGFYANNTWITPGILRIIINIILIIIVIFLIITVFGLTHFGSVRV